MKMNRNSCVRPVDAYPNWQVLPEHGNISIIWWREPDKNCLPVVISLPKKYVEITINLLEKAKEECQ